MVTGVDIKLVPVPGTTSGEMFKFRLTKGLTLKFDIDNYTTITTSEGGTVTSEFFPVDSDKLLTVSEVGVDFSNPLIKLPVNQIRYILCYNS
jgi:hypothetical protein